TTYTAGHEWINLGTTCTGGGDGNGGDGTDYQPIPGTPENPNTNPNPGGSGGNGTNSGDQNNTGGVYGDGGIDGSGHVYTTPTITPNEKIVDDSFKNMLNPNQLNWWNNHTNMHNILLDYLCTELPDIEDIMTNEEVVTSNIDGQMSGEQPEEIINELKKMPCQSSIITDSYGLCSSLSTSFVDSYAGTDVYKITYKTSGSLTAQGLTKVVGRPFVNGHISHNIDVTFRRQMLNSATDLFIAQTVIHENLHAVLLYLAFAMNDSIPLNSNPDFSSLLEIYMHNHNINSESAQHTFMTQLVTNIAEAIQEYGVSKVIYQRKNILLWLGQVWKKPLHLSFYILRNYNRQIFYKIPISQELKR
ncbi:MAG TPA: hypothetical protein VK623_09925, partial [Flavobacterium sp.]|nr:hypothetical protein [Flavobacterium sp.]